MKKEDKILKDIHCKDCGHKGTLIYFGKRRRRSGDPEQLIRCTECKRVFLTEQEHFKGLHADKEIIFQILKSLVAPGKTVRSVADEIGKSPGAIQRTRNGLKSFIIEKLDDVALKTGLSRNEVVEFIRRDRKWDKDKD